MPAALMLHKEDPREALIEKIGSVEDVELFHNQVLVAVYVAPDTFASGIIRPDLHRDEDRHQSKVGLVLKVGPKAFQESDGWRWPPDMGVGDWIFYRVSDGWSVTLNSDRERLCRVLDDVDIKGRVQHPDQVW